MTKLTLQRRSQASGTRDVPTKAVVAPARAEPKPVPSSNGPTGPELIDEIGQEPTLDRLMQRDARSRPATDEELTTLVNSLRRDRAQMLLKDEKRSAKKQGVEEPEDDANQDDVPTD